MYKVKKINSELHTKLPLNKSKYKINESLTLVWKTKQFFCTHVPTQGHSQPYFTIFLNKEVYFTFRCRQVHRFPQE